MQWIEHFFGISPDGGSGALELGLAFLPIVLLVVLTRWLLRTARNRNPPGG